MDLYNIHEKYMSRAIHLAKKGQGMVSPNPMVGCVIVKNGEIIGEGYHKKFGESHAEIVAFKNCIKDPTDAAIYVTLEPCSHHGKTPPCTNAIIKSKIKKVIYSIEDSDIRSSNKSKKILKSNHIQVKSGLFKKELKNFYKVYN